MEDENGMKCPYTQKCNLCTEDKYGLSALVRDYLCYGSNRENNNPVMESGYQCSAYIAYRELDRVNTERIKLEESILNLLKKK